jgi:putative hydrolase of the HAD superfamily
MEQINGFGAKIDFRNYLALKNNVIKTRRILNGELRQVIIEICKLILPQGYEKIILKRIELEITGGEKKYYQISPEVKKVVATLSKNHTLAMISNNCSNFSLELLKKVNLYNLFKFIVFPSELNSTKPDERLFLDLMKKANVTAAESVVIGDRLDTDIYPANKVGITTIRITDSIFNLQSPECACEIPTYSVAKLKATIEIIDRIYKKL